MRRTAGSRGQSQHRVDPDARAGVLRLVNAQNDAVGASGSAVLSSVPLPGYQDLSAHAWIRVLFCLFVLFYIRAVFCCDFQGVPVLRTFLFVKRMRGERERIVSERFLSIFLL